MHTPLTQPRTLPLIALHPKHAARFLKGYPWIYANEIIPDSSQNTLPPGSLVQLTLQGKPLSIGYFNRHSLIIFRELSRNPDDTIDTAFFIHRFTRALNIRTQFFDQPYYRFIHAEADGLPGLIIDRFDSVFVLQLNTQGMEKLKQNIIEALSILFTPTTIFIKNETKARVQEGLENKENEIIGTPRSTLSIIENQTPYLITLDKSQKTGWFFDHRENRKMIAELSTGKTVLDYFCYGGGFSILAAKSGAKKVVGVDRSETAIQDARKSAELNQVESLCEFITREIFEDMKIRLDNQETFDIVILDPPAFVKTKKDLQQGLKGYEKLIKLGLGLCKPTGNLMIASCSYHVKDAELQEVLASALGKQQRKGRILKKLQAGWDHPCHPLLEESHYLKGFLLALD